MKGYSGEIIRPQAFLLHANISLIAARNLAWVNKNNIENFNYLTGETRYSKKLQIVLEICKKNSKRIYHFATIKVGYNWAKSTFIFKRTSNDLLPTTLDQAF